jgi:hypothetical protein
VGIVHTVAESVEKLDVSLAPLYLLGNTFDGVLQPDGIQFPARLGGHQEVGHQAGQLVYDGQHVVDLV